MQGVTVESGVVQPDDRGHFCLYGTNSSTTDYVLQAAFIVGRIEELRILKHGDGSIHDRDDDIDS